MSKKRAPLNVVLLVALVVSLLPARMFAAPVSTPSLQGLAWYDTNWQYRREVAISSPCGEEITDYQVQVTLDSSFDFSHALSDGSDVRFTAADGETPIPFWIETWDPGNQTASIWVSVPLIPASDTTVYLYYGNPTASSMSDGTTTFEAYDGFEDNDVGSIPAVPTPDSWTKYAGNPVIPCSNCAFGSTFFDSDTGIYHNFVSWGTILHYTSDDGLNWVADDANNPILTPSQPWEGSNVGVPMVWKEDGTWYMFYRGGSPDRIGLATSTDAVNWTKSSANPVILGDPGAWDDRDLDPWGVIKVGDTYYLWYNTIGAVPGLGRATGLATSTNLTDWTKDPNNPIFTDGRFCAFPFRYAGDYYLLIPHYTSGTDYSQIELYRDSSPTFYPADREYLGVAINYGPTDWDDHDQDTPSVLTDDIYRDTFAASGNRLWVYYAGEGGSGWGQTGLVIEEDIAAAIAGVQPNALTWSATGDITVVDAPVRQGTRSVRQRDASSSSSTQLRGTFEQMSQGVVGAWMRRSSTSFGDYDIYLYEGSTLSCVAGLGRDGDFHHWNGDFQPTGVAWAPDTWYLVTLAFDATTDLYDFVVYDEGLNELVRVEGISFGNASGSIDAAVLYTSSGFQEDGFGDDFRVRQHCGAEATATVGDEETQPGVNGPPTVSDPSPANEQTGVSVSLAELSFTVSDEEGDTIDYTVTMSPDAIGGPQSATGIPSGTTIHVPMTGGPLDYGTTYTWEVQATDPHGSGETTIETYTFTTEAAIVPETSVTDYYDDRQGAMALNFDTELYLCGMIHSMNGYDPSTAASRSQDTRVGWPHIIEDCEAYDIPVSFNICGHEPVFGDAGISEIAEIDVYHSWHSDPHWATHTWYSDKPVDGGNYKMTGDLSGYTRSYDLVYGGDLTEQTLNSAVPFEISYHNFGHESLSDISEALMDATFRLGVEYHKRIGSKIRAEAPPWNNNPQASKYPIYLDNGIFVFNRNEGSMGQPYEVIENLWIVPRSGYFTASSDLTGLIDSAMSDGVVLAHYSHPEDGFESTSRSSFQDSLAYARSKVDSGELWATTLSEIGRYWEAKSDVSAVTQIVGGRTIVDITLTGYDVALFGIPYLTFRSTMPDSSSYARITVDYPSTQIVNSDSSTVRVESGEVVYTIYLNPTSVTHVEIEGVDVPYTAGVDINEPILTIESTPPADPLESTPITIQATADSTDEIYTVNLIYQRNDDARDSRIMAYNGGVWESEIGPFDAGDVMNYYVSVTDNSGRRERSEDKAFVVSAGADFEPPEWQNQGQSDASPEYGTPVQLYAEGRDNAALRYARLETDETGAWEERTEYDSPMDLGDVANTWVTSSFTWDNPAISVGTVVSWRIRYEDASGNESVTDAMSFTIEPAFVDDEPPQYSDPSIDSTDAGQPVEFSLRWTDNVGLDGYIFSLDNGTGTFADDPFAEFTEGASGGPWWNPDWDYRQEITIDNSGSADALSDYAVLVTVDTASLISAGRMNEHGGDIRFIDGDEELDFWVESGLNTANTRIWVKVPEIPASAVKQIAMYYGNPNRSVPQSDGHKTFPVFDNFGGRGWEEFKYSGNPVMGPGSPAGGGGTFSSVLRESEIFWRMYSSYDSDNSDIGMSTSEDGLIWEHQGVVLRKGSSGEWDSSNTWCPAVWKEDDIYYMLHPATGPVGMQMGLATSPDGVTWTKYDDPTTTDPPYAESDPVFNDPNWATGDTEAPCFSVLKEGDTYYVMYNTLGSHRRSSVAYSTDLINWTPAYDYPRFPGGPSTASWNYNTFCGNVFKYEDMFYLVLPGQDSSKNYAKYGLYVSHSPSFPEDDTEFKGIVMTGNPTGWEDEDMDTPWVVQFDGMMHLYYAACGSCWSQTGVAIIDDIALALAQAYPPGNYINVNRDATVSQQIMPPVGWEKSIPGYLEINSQNFSVTLDPAVSGRAIVQYDGNSTDALELYKDISSLDKGAVSAWMRASNTDTGDYDLYLYGDSQATLAMAAGLGGNGYFHYWNGDFADTAVTYSADTWYLIQIEFDVAADQYNFAVYDTSFAELVRVEGIGFGGAISTGIDQINYRTSGSFNGNAYVDNVFVRHAAATEPGVTVGPESTQTFTDAWSRVTKVVNSTPGVTIRWRFSANDTSDNWNTSDIYSFVTTLEDTPPTVVLNAPEDDHWTSTSSVDFSATCSDEYDVTEVSLYGDWSGAWAQIDTVSGPGLNGTEVIFSETVPDGSWTWNVECYDDTGNSSWGVARTIHVDSEPDPWWLCGYDYRKRLIVHENSGHDLSDYPVYGIMDTAALIAAGKMQPDCDDVGVVYDGTEIPSQVMDCNTENTKVWLQTDLVASESKHGFYLYHGNPTAIAPDYSSRSSIAWDNATWTMDTGKITGAFDPDGGIISQIRDNTNGQDLVMGDDQRGLGYLFSENPLVYYIFRVDESDDTIALTVDGPIVKVVTSYSGESPQWIQENIFFNNQDFVDFRVYRPAEAPTERFLTGANLISPDGVFSTADTNELLRVDNSSTDISVVFDEVWRFDPTNNRGYVGVVNPDFTNELALIWDESYTADFTWKPRSAAPRAGSYSLFIGGDGTIPAYGTIDADTFDYRLVLRHSSSPSNDDTQPIYDYYVAHPPAVTFGPEETPSADTTPPTVTITSPTNTTYDVDTIPLTFSVSEGVQWCGYSLNGGDMVDLEGCGDTVLTGLADGPYELTVYADDCAGNRGSSTVNFSVEIVPFAWWDTAWHYRVPITVDSGDYSRTNEPIEHVKNFTQEWVELGETGLTFDINSVRVVEYTADGDLIGEVPSQFDPAADYDAATNAVGTIVWIMSGTTDAHTTRYYYVYFDSTDDPKPAPSYVTDLDWNSGTHTLSNTTIDATIGSVFDSGVNRTGINTFRYNDIEYTTASVAGGAGIYYVTSETAGADTYEVLIDGPVKKTVKITPTANGEVSFTLYDRSEFIRAEGSVSGSGWSAFTVFPYAHSLNTAALSNQLHYYNAGGVVDESVGTQGWLSDAPDEGWACYDGLGANKDLCLVTDGTTLASTNNFWRYSSTSHQLIFPAWNPNPGFPIEPLSWIVMGDTYQDGRDFWNRLSSPVIQTQGTPEALPPPLTEIPLNTGWNLVSVPRIQSDSAITEVLSTIDGSYDLVYAYDGCGDGWQKYDVNAEPYANNLTDLDHTLGFWVRVSQPVTLTVAGAVPDSTVIPLCEGWDLVGYPSQTTRDLPDVLSGVSFDLVYAYDAFVGGSPWQKYDVNADPYANTLTEMTPTRGYWIRVDAYGEWTVER